MVNCNFIHLGPDTSGYFLIRKPLSVFLEEMKQSGTMPVFVLDVCAVLAQGILMPEADKMFVSHPPLSLHFILC